MVLRNTERYQEEDFERFPEYEKIIPFLTISEKEKMRLDNGKLKKEKSELEIQTNEKDRLLENYKKLEDRTKRLERMTKKE